MYDMVYVVQYYDIQYFRFRYRYGIRLRTALCAIYIMHYTDRSTVLCLLYKYISVVLT